MVHRNRSKLRMILSSPAVCVAALLLLFFLAKGAWGIHSRAVDSAARLEAARTELAELEATRSLAAAQTARLSTESGIKAEVREKYRAVEPGESVAVIVDTAPQKPVATSTATSSEPVRKSWWRRLFTRD